MKGWIDDIKHQAQNDLKYYIVGNKCDDEGSRVISTEDAKKFAEENYMTYFETSAKDGTGIEETILDLANELLSEWKVFK